MNNLNWTKSPDGLVPAIIQDAKTKAVLMLGYMNAEALKKTEATRQVTFFSRTKQELWLKGETSGNFLNVVEIKADCDQDAILILVNPVGPACHRNTTTCFDEVKSEPAFSLWPDPEEENASPQNAGGIGNEFEILSVLEKTLQERFQDASEPDQGKKSYTKTLIAVGLDRIIQKVGEEAIETVIAAKNDDLNDLKGEAADLMYHLMVMLQYKKTSLTEVMEVLRQRHQ
jgi:phosphoribosyl-ATP pyrophosphohydrolase/phosphoribosyl-AMP cyclohydrolase